jgi:hypothetical protein
METVANTARSLSILLPAAVLILRAAVATAYRFEVPEAATSGDDPTIKNDKGDRGPSEGRPQLAA